MSKVTKVLNSKRTVSGNIDVWWYNISSPSKLTPNDVIQFNLWDVENRNLIKRAIIDLSENWLSRIRRASTHFYKGIEICKVHIQRMHGSKGFLIYFGRKEDGTYLLPDS